MIVLMRKHTQQVHSHTYLSKLGTFPSAHGYPHMWCQVWGWECHLCQSESGQQSTVRHSPSSLSSHLYTATPGPSASRHIYSHPWSWQTCLTGWCTWGRWCEVRQKAASPHPWQWPQSRSTWVYAGCCPSNWRRSPRWGSLTRKKQLSCLRQSCRSRSVSRWWWWRCWGSQWRQPWPPPGAHTCRRRKTWLSGMASTAGKWNDQSGSHALPLVPGARQRRRFSPACHEIGGRGRWRQSSRWCSSPSPGSGPLRWCCQGSPGLWAWQHQGLLHLLSQVLPSFVFSSPPPLLSMGSHGSSPETYRLFYKN